MPTSTVEQLSAQIAQTRDNPAIVRESCGGMGLDDLRQTFLATRSALTAAVEAARDSAFEKQPPNREGEEVWSVGEIVGHCNGSAVGIAGRALELMEIDLGEPPESLRRWTESRVMTRDEAREALAALDVNEFYGMLPADAKLDNSGDHDFFGPMSARSWLYFVAMHEAEHVRQVEDLSG